MCTTPQEERPILSLPEFLRWPHSTQYGCQPYEVLFSYRRFCITRKLNMVCAGCGIVMPPDDIWDNGRSVYCHECGSGRVDASRKRVFD